MFYDDHRPPHFHVVYQDTQATVRIDTLEILWGNLPGRAHSLVTEWALAHRDELRQNWDRAERGEPWLASCPWSSAHGKITRLEVRKPFSLYVEFDDGLKGEYDMKDRLNGPVLSRFRIRRTSHV